MSGFYPEELYGSSGSETPGADAAGEAPGLRGRHVCCHEDLNLSIVDVCDHKFLTLITLNLRGCCATLTWIQTSIAAINMSDAVKCIHLLYYVMNYTDGTEVECRL